MNKNLRLIQQKSIFVCCLLISTVLLFQAIQAKVEINITNSKANGFWEQIGYGRIIEIKDNVLLVYDISKVSCFVSFEKKLDEIGKITKVNKKSLTIVDGLNKLHFKRPKKLPKLCTSNKAKRSDSLYNFDALWHSFNENYAYFKTRNVNWDDYYKKYRSRLSADSTELELYDVLKEMLESIGDGHINLETPDSVKENYKKRQSESKAEDKKPTDSNSKLNNYQLRQRIRKSITDYYLDDVKFYNSGIVRWGMMKDDVGYVQINWMIFLANYDIPEGTDIQEFVGKWTAIAEKRPNQKQDEYDGAKFAIQKVLKDLKDAKSMIVDIRFNGGGKDESALEFLSHFNSKKRIGFTKKARLGNKFTNKNKVFVNSSEHPFTGNVYLLTSPQTASAAEIMTLGAIELANIKRIGSETEGIFSDVLEKKLPNGWEYSLSNEVYQDLKGNDYENKGIPPHHKINYSRETREFYNQMFEQMSDGDDAIEMALKMIRSEK